MLLVVMCIQPFDINIISRVKPNQSTLQLGLCNDSNDGDKSCTLMSTILSHFVAKQHKPV